VVVDGLGDRGTGTQVLGKGRHLRGDKLHVIVLNWNGEGVIAPCLDSLLAVDNTPMSLIVVDNASVDSSKEIIKRDYPGVVLIENESNLLFAEGNNTGIRYALEDGGDRFLILNNDTVVDPKFASRMLEAMDRSGAGIVGPKILYHDDPERIWYGGGDFYPIVWIPRHKSIRKLTGTFDDDGAETGYVSGCAMLVRKEVIEDIGLFDPSYRIYCEDVDFCLRAREAGWKCYYEPEALVWHKVSSSSGGGFTPFKMENRLRSTHKLFQRFKPMWWRVLLFPVHLSGFMLLLGALILRGKFGLAAALLRGAWGIARGG